MKRMHWLFLIPLSLILLGGPAAADVANGDFEIGGTGWTTTVPPDWEISFPPDGGNPDGNASIISRFWDSEGMGCVSQDFLCGQEDDQGTCTITFDAIMNWLDSNPFAGRLKVYVNGSLLWTAPDVNEMPWVTVQVVGECGLVTLDLCLEVDDGNNMWQGRYDNVTAECDAVPAESIHWGMLKSRYR